MVLKWFRRKNKDKETDKAIMYGILSGAVGRPVPETQAAQALGINLHMIEDDKLNALLEGISIIKHKDGTFDVDLNAVALRVMVSKLIRSSWVDPIDSEIAQLEIERFINRIEIDMEEDTYEIGGTNLLEALAKVIQTAWSDAKTGRKAKLMKVTPRVFEISMPERKKSTGVLPT